MTILKYKKENRIVIVNLKDINLRSDYKDGILNISYQESLSVVTKDNIDSYSIYDNGTLIEHQDKLDYK